MKFNVIKFLKAQLSVALATLLVTYEFFEEKIGRLLAVLRFNWFRTRFYSDATWATTLRVAHWWRLRDLNS